MGVWRPSLSRRMAVMRLAAGETPTWAYTLDANERKVFSDGSVAFLEFKNSYGQTEAVWQGEIFGGVVSFPDANAEEAAQLGRGTTFTLNLEDADGRPRQPLWGHVVRDEARYPDHPDNSSRFEGVQYEYSFGTPGRLRDPNWRIIRGRPWVYDNSDQSWPNGVAAGNWNTGQTWPVAAMLYFAPLKGDGFRMTYNTIPRGNGYGWVIVSSDYNMTNFCAIGHQRGTGNNDYVSIATGTKPYTDGVIDRVAVNRNTLFENFTVEYNPSSNRYSVYAGESTEPLLSYHDGVGHVNHGEGERYVGFMFKSTLLNPGVEFADWYIQDAVS